MPVLQEPACVLGIDTSNGPLTLGEITEEWNPGPFLPRIANEPPEL